MTPIAEVRIPVKLAGERALIFNGNTQMKYEEFSGKRYFATIAEFLAIYQRHTKEPPADAPDRKPIVDTMGLMEDIPIKEVLCMVCAACHEYDKDDNPTWPLTPSKLGRMTKSYDLAALFPLLVLGHSGNVPTKSELGESAPANVVAMPVKAEPETTPATGGPSTIDLPAADFA